MVINLFLEREEDSMKTAKEYSEILKMVLELQINYITENPDYYESEYLQGKEAGLLIAIDKIKASEFLME